MNIIWLVVILLILLLCARKGWRVIQNFLSQQRSKPPMKHHPTETERPPRQSSVYSFSGRSLSVQREEVKGFVPLHSPVLQPTKSSSYSSVPVAFPALADQLHELATQAWTTDQSSWSQLLLNPADFVNITAPTQVVEVLIRHARRTVPGFNVPHMIPRVLVVSLPAAAGMFKVDDEGWVTIELGANFFQDKLAAQAILAHEVCHYILENSGVRKKDVYVNEQYTDLCMFVCGFGEIFLAGYRRNAAQQDYCPGHRLGYLTDAEYQFAQQYVMRLRQFGEISLPQELETLKKRLHTLLNGDSKCCNRCIEFERRRSQYKSEVELYRDAIDRLERDRGY
jgi:hypothetical protein